MNTPSKESTTISMIVATSLNGAIGRNNTLLWHIPEDLRYFKKVTGGNTVIMGRKTWESIGKPLPYRRNIVISRSLSQNSGKAQSRLPASVELFCSLEEAVNAAKRGNPQEIFIIGGGEIYRRAIDITDKIYLTIVDKTIQDADTFFPEIDYSKWKKTNEEKVDYGERCVLVRK